MATSYFFFHTKGLEACESTKPAVALAAPSMPGNAAAPPDLCMALSAFFAARRASRSAGVSDAFRRAFSSALRRRRSELEREGAAAAAAAAAAEEEE